LKRIREKKYGIECSISIEHDCQSVLTAKMFLKRDVTSNEIVLLLKDHDITMIQALNTRLSFLVGSENFKLKCYNDSSLWMWKCFECTLRSHSIIAGEDYLASLMIKFTETDDT
jgi:hypothetical protein